MSADKIIFVAALLCVVVVAFAWVRAMRANNFIDWLPVVLAIFIVMRATMGQATEQPPPKAKASFSWPADETSITCRMVRLALRFHAADELESMARAHGVSDATIARLHRCVS